jgi:hypothetical protein
MNWRKYSTTAPSISGYEVNTGWLNSAGELSLSDNVKLSILCIISWVCVYILQFDSREIRGRSYSPFSGGFDPDDENQFDWAMDISEYIN